MKKKIFLILAIMAMLVCALTVVASAKSVYLEPIPDELKAENDTVTHFVVFEEEKYFKGSGSTISELNGDEMNKDMAAAGIDSSKIGTEYLTRYNFPAYMNGTLITYVNLNSMKTHSYFKNVCGYIQLEGTVNKVHDMNECVSQLRCIDFGENSQITAIPLCFASYARKMASVKNFPRNLTTIGKDAFNSCYGAFRGELYIDAETIESNAFNNAISNVTHLILGPKVKYIGTQALTVLFSIQHYNEIPTYYAPADLKPALESIEFQCDVSQITFAYQGNNSGAFYFPESTARSSYEKLTTIILSNPNNAKYVTEGSVFNDFTAEGVTILFNDSDGLDDYVTAKHDFSILEGVSYESFDKEGAKIMKCANCGAISYESGAAPLFNCLGYSVPSDGRGEITIGFTVDRDAIKQYESINGEDIKFGVFAVLKDRIGNQDIFANDGTPLSETISAELTNHSIVAFELRLLGFDGELRDIELAMGAYVYDSKENKYSYLQFEAPNEGDKYHFSSYNEIIG